MSKNKAPLKKTIFRKIYEDGISGCTVHFGTLKRLQGNPGKTAHLFKVIGEKLPSESLAAVRKHVRNNLRLAPYGVYVAHDSMGCPRYIGRGSVFHRLNAIHKCHARELKYFSFYLVSEKKHEREIETLLIRAASFLLHFNSRKKQIGVSHGNICDYEAGTNFFERQLKKGKKKNSGRVRSLEESSSKALAPIEVPFMAHSVASAIR